MPCHVPVFAAGHTAASPMGYLVPETADEECAWMNLSVDPDTLTALQQGRAALVPIVELPCEPVRDDAMAVMVRLVGIEIHLRPEET